MDARRLREPAPRRIQVELELTREGRQHHLAQIAGGLAPREHDALENGKARIAEDERLAHASPCAEATALGDGAARGGD